MCISEETISSQQRTFLTIAVLNVTRRRQAHQPFSAPVPAEACGLRVCSADHAESDACISPRTVSRVKEDCINAGRTRSAGSRGRGVACPETGLQSQTRVPPKEGGRGTALAEPVWGEAAAQARRSTQRTEGVLSERSAKFLFKATLLHWA